MAWREIQEGRLWGYGVINVIGRQMDNSMAGAVRRGNVASVAEVGASSYVFLRMEEV